MTARPGAGRRASPGRLRRWAGDRLARRQAGAAVLIALTLGASLGTLQLVSDYRQERVRIEGVGRGISTMMAEPASRAAYTLDAALAEAVVAAMVASRPVVSVELLDNLGRPLASGGRPLMRLPWRRLTDRLFGDHLRYEVPLTPRGVAPGAGEAAREVVGRLVLRLDTRVMAQDFLARAALLLGVAVAYGLLLGAVLAAVFHLMVTRPLTRMVQALEGVDPAAPTAAPGLVAGARHERDELGRLARASNDLVRRFGDTLAELRHSRALYAAIVEHALDAIVTVDEAGRIVEFNPAAERLFGLPRARALGLPATQALSPARLRGGHEAGLRRLALSRGRRLPAWRIETEAARADGSTFPAELSVGAIRAGGRRLFTAHIRDLSERRDAEADRRRLEAELHHAEKMKALGTLAGGVAHDFNNILATVFTSAEVALAGVPPGSGAGRALARVLAAGKRGRDLVGQIMVFSRAEQRPGLAIDLGQAVAEAVELCRAALPPGIELAYDPPPGTILVLANEAQIHRLVSNLCSNAADAMPDGGVVRVRLRRGAPGGPGVPQGAACLAVADSGTGMDAATAARLFEPFFTTKPLGKGTGLGLAMVHGLVTSLEGSVAFDTAPGRGTTFRVRLPVVASGAAEPRTLAGPPPMPAGEGRAVLLAVGDPALRASVGGMLRAAGFRVAAHSDPEDALAAFAADPGAHHLLIAETVMPGLSGLDLLDVVRAARADLPAILLAPAGERVAETGPGVRVLHKPVLRLELMAALAETFATREPVPCPAR